jgi:hypothetical protein
MGDAFLLIARAAPEGHIFLEFFKSFVRKQL